MAVWNDYQELVSNKKSINSKNNSKNRSIYLSILKFEKGIWKRTNVLKTKFNILMKKNIWEISEVFRFTWFSKRNTKEFDEITFIS